MPDSVYHCILRLTNWAFFRVITGFLAIEARPGEVSKSRIKRLRGLSQPQFRLRVGEIRIYCDVSAKTVEVLAILTKAQAAAWLKEKGVPSEESGPSEG